MFCVNCETLITPKLTREKGAWKKEEEEWKQREMTILFFTLPPFHLYHHHHLSISLLTFRQKMIRSSLLMLWIYTLYVEKHTHTLYCSSLRDQSSDQSYLSLPSRFSRSLLRFLLLFLIIHYLQGLNFVLSFQFLWIVGNWSFSLLVSEKGNIFGLLRALNLLSVIGLPRDRFDG